MAASAASNRLFTQRLKRIVKAYPSLNLMMKVDNGCRQASIVLPGLRYDDIDYSGKPDVRRMYDMMGRVEFAAFTHERPFLDYTILFREKLTNLIKACKYEIKSDFYETTMPKAPLAFTISLANVGESTFTTVNEFTCGGHMKASVKMTTLHALVNLESGEKHPLPSWWKRKFTNNIGEHNPLVVTPLQSPDLTHCQYYTVPHSDVDTYGRTRCSSYVRYFIDTASIASSRDFYKNMDHDLQEYPLKKMSMLYAGPSRWGDTLLSETWENEDNSNTLHCIISQKGSTVWSSSMELYSVDDD